ncbi:MAG TPA: imidazoleglycerol-phosphate dehydratase HisB [Candidatus Ratteibacteria bacterium]|jgi:imidazoleglycerol-phosphate dehydratase|uniref:Imidazoleglycerol-phosphate dehydratase n=1 Tax=candidate division TA06 bacterium ADurb.Bin131 TaxID=1852827 RepID=A0A1V6CDS8_UNCT6|nr:MAG: Imidazoleglycerol-phosphate dehydratase [candidate division TA06 bacterium ADurb.Bin131]HON05484.1 imidazoleglycerol-phosphate dehydratase HisB [bacterium]HRS05932.1 imidazoleglycerol-phosphate dehydratase HisB [Candidatus Ratteibacteria bacterium]HOQ81781.1 imidazoleglycerol-phosphate dehydratase HisB [bacterium]HPC28604.1 imidazoleglycerol-phosphate dehydratase HisB [bacterium]
MVDKNKLRHASVIRNTKETSINLNITVDGSGKSDICCPLGFWSHMLSLFSFFGRFDIVLKATGDVYVDDHHLVEDMGICFGQAFNKALGDRKGITRFGFIVIPMDETLIQVSLDISGRPFLGFSIPVIRNKSGYSDIENLQEFMRGFANHSGITLHLRLFSGENTHHICEATFKGLGLALRQAIKVEHKGTSSTKGVID